MITSMITGGILIVDPGSKIFFRDSFIPGDQGLVPVSDRGFLYGDGVFETIRVYGGNPFRALEHLGRLQEGAQVLGIPLPYPLDEIEGILYDTLRVNHTGEGFLRVSLSRGPGERGLLPRGCHAPLLLVASSAGLPYGPEDYRRGFQGVIIQGTRRNSFSPLSRIKSFNYLDNILARREAARRGSQEGILLNTLGNLAGGTVTNLFLVREGELLTPSTGCGILPGITRQVVLGLAQDMGVPCREGPLPAGELVGAREAFLTNTLLEIMPLVSLGGRPLGPGEPGPLTRELQGGLARLARGP